MTTPPPLVIAPVEVLLVGGSPSGSSRSSALLDVSGRWLRERGFAVSQIELRELPAQALLQSDVNDPDVRASMASLEKARGVVLASPVYKASFSGLLKVWLDLLPQYGLTDKVVMPLSLGGSPGGMLAIDYSLRPVLVSMNAWHITESVFAHMRSVRLEGDEAALESDVRERLERTLERFSQMCRMR